MAWRTLHHSSEQGLIDSLLHELPAANLPPERPSDVEANVSNGLDYRRPPLGDLVDEHSSLLSEQHVSLREHTRLQQPESHYTTHKQRSSDGLQISFEEDPTLPFVGLNALEIAAIADAKKFLSHPVVQKIINGIWLVLSGLSLIDAYIIQSHCIYPGSSLIFFPFVSSFIGLLACCLIDQERNAYPEITIRSGDIVFWESLSVHTKKKAQLYCKRSASYLAFLFPVLLRATETHPRPGEPIHSLGSVSRSTRRYSKRFSSPYFWVFTTRYWLRETLETSL